MKNKVKFSLTGRWPRYPRDSRRFFNFERVPCYHGFVPPIPDTVDGRRNETGRGERTLSDAIRRLDNAKGSKGSVRIMPVFPEVVGRVGEGEMDFSRVSMGYGPVGRNEHDREAEGRIRLGERFGGIDETTGEKVAAIRIK